MAREQPDTVTFYRLAGERLRAARLALGYGSAAALARRLELPAATVRRFERGQLRRPGRTYVVTLAGYRLLGINPAWLISGEHGGMPAAIADKLIAAAPSA